MKLNIFNQEEEVLENLAAHLVVIAKEAIFQKGRGSIVLSGGSSPKKLYELLSRSFKDALNWRLVDFFFGDERYVPLTHAESNYLMAKQSLFDPLGIPEDNVYSFHTALPPSEAAEEYHQRLTAYFGKENWEFDLILLGLGDDAHTASLFPGTEVLKDDQPAVKANFLPEKQIYRLTLNAPLINQARHIAFLVYGSSKSAAVQQVLKQPFQPSLYPAQLIKPQQGELQWFLDKEAGAGLRP